MPIPTPPTILLAAGGLALVSGRFLAGRFSKIWEGYFFVSLLVSSVCLWMDPITSNATAASLRAVWTNDSLAVSEQWLGLLFGLISGIALFRSPNHESDSWRTYGFLAFAVAGLMLVARANDFLSLGLSLEIVALAVMAFQKHTMATLPSTSAHSMDEEHSTDHFPSRPWSDFLLSGCLWLGIGLLSNVVVTTQFEGVRRVLFDQFHGDGHSSTGTPSKVMLLATGMIVMSLAGRMGLVPFHLGMESCQDCRSRVGWGFCVVSGQLAGSMGLCRLCGRVFASLGPHLVVVLTVVALASFFLAGVMFVRGCSPGVRSIPRWLSGLVLFQSAWLILGVMTAAMDLEHPEVRWGAFPDQHETVSLIVYSQFAGVLGLMGVAGIVDCLKHGERRIEFVEDLRGLGLAAPLVAMAVLVCLASLLGSPWTAGFWSRWLMVLAANNVHVKATASFFEPHGGIRFVILSGVIATIVAAGVVTRLFREMFLESPLTRAMPSRGRGPFWAGLMSAVTCLLLGVGPEILLLPLRSMGTPHEPRLEVPSKGSGKNRSVLQEKMRRPADFNELPCQARSVRQVSNHLLISTKLACCTWQSSTCWAQFCPVRSGTSSADHQPREDNPFILVDPDS